MAHVMDLLELALLAWILAHLRGLAAILRSQQRSLLPPPSGNGHRNHDTGTVDLPPFLKRR